MGSCSLRLHPDSTLPGVAVPEDPAVPREKQAQVVGQATARRFHGAGKTYCLNFGGICGTHDPIGAGAILADRDGDWNGVGGSGFAIPAKT